MIVVCGDSFMAPDPKAPGKHFSEIMGAYSLAKPGCGNIDICFQIDEAIKLGADRVIIGTTDSARTELRITDTTLHDLRLHNFRNGDYISDTIPTLIGEEPDIKDKYKLTQTKRNAVKQYFTEIYDALLKNKTDMWALGYWYVQLRDNNIHYDVLERDFCIYTHAQEYPDVPYSFHTDFYTQKLAANLLLKNENTYIR
jgi:hypothetical protein